MRGVVDTFEKPKYWEVEYPMLEFDTTEVRKTCDKDCKYHIAFYSGERVFLHSNNCNRRWTNEGQKGKRVTESVSPRSSDKRSHGFRQPFGQVTIDSFNHLCANCKGPARSGYMYCSECWR